MKYSLALATVALVGKSLAFSTRMFEALATSPEALSACASLKKRQLLGINVGFDPEAQAVSATGQHVFVPSGKGDIRGVCPSLNALANHNFLLTSQWRCHHRSIHHCYKQKHMA